MPEYIPSGDHVNYSYPFPLPLSSDDSASTTSDFESRFKKFWTKALRLVGEAFVASAQTDEANAAATTKLLSKAFLGIRRSLEKISDEERLADAVGGSLMQLREHLDKTDRSSGKTKQAMYVQQAQDLIVATARAQAMEREPVSVAAQELVRLFSSSKSSHVPMLGYRQVMDYAAVDVADDFESDKEYFADVKSKYLQEDAVLAYVPVYKEEETEHPGKRVTKAGGIVSEVASASAASFHELLRLQSRL